MSIKVERTWNFIFLIKSLRHATFIELQLFIIVIAGEKLFSKQLWHRLRPPASVVLDVHRGTRGPRAHSGGRGVPRGERRGRGRPGQRRPRPRPSPGERRRPPRRLLPGPGNAGRGTDGAARPMLSSRHREKWSRNEVPQCLKDLYVLFSLSPSLLLMEIILNLYLRNWTCWTS